MRTILPILLACLTCIVVATLPAYADEAPGPSHVVFETTAGDIIMELHPEWSPIGVAHFIDLVERGFYDGAPWFRVIDNWVAQCGISASEAENKAFGEANIQDDPVVQGNTRGYVAYGMTDQPNSRSTHIYINFADNSRLDAKGFACFAQVVEGMDVADSLYRIPDDVMEKSGIDQDKLGTAEGFAQFQQAFPEADYITRAYVSTDYEHGPANVAPETALSYVKLVCSNGDIVLEVHPEWAPLGAARFFELVEADFYAGAPFFRAIDGFMMQTGLAADYTRNIEWQERRICDDPIQAGISNTEGMVSFAMAGPNTRTTQFFINFRDNSMLDDQGFSPFARVVEGKEVVDSVFRTGENPARVNVQGLLHQQGGLARVKELYPEMDFILSAELLHDYAPPASTAQPAAE